MERPGRHLTVGLVLSGGGARGFAHIGVLRALERAGRALDMVGDNAGALDARLEAQAIQQEIGDRAGLAPTSRISVGTKNSPSTWNPLNNIALMSSCAG